MLEPSGPLVVQTFVPASIPCDALSQTSAASQTPARTPRMIALTAISLMFTPMSPIAGLAHLDADATYGSGT